jgi:hypothetical protein
MSRGEDATQECWKTTGPGGKARYTDAATQTSRMLRTAFKVALPQAETLLVIQPASVPPLSSDRQHRAASLRGGSMVGGQAWCEVAPDVAQAASGG